ncbi:MAG: cation:proton antiporter [Rickettsiales bacterium]
MEGHGAIPYLGEIITILIAAGILVPLFNRIRISPVLGYLAVGFIFGPFGLTSVFTPSNDIVNYLTIDDPSEVAHLAEFGIVFLMFMIGLELSPQRLWAMRKMVFGLGALQVVLSIAAITGLSLLFLASDITTSLIIGAALGLSSTAIVMQILADRRLISTPIGRSSFSILLFQDIAVVPILIIIGLVALGAQGGVGAVIGLALGKAMLAIAVLLLIGHFLLRPVFRLAGSAKGAEPFMAVTFLTVILAAVFTEQAGLSMALGAFIGGLLLAETEYRHAIEVYIEPFKGLLLGLFFMSVGMGIDPKAIRIDAEWILLAVVALILIKASIIAVLARWFGLSRAAAVESGLLLSQGGEFAFVIVGAAMGAKLVTPSFAQFLLLVAGLSMVVTPFVAMLGRRLGDWIAKRETIVMLPDAPEDIPQMHHHVLIAGFGRVGRAVANILESEGISYLAIEANAELMNEHRAARLPVIYGDALNGSFLVHCHPELAQAALITMADTEISLKIIKSIRERWPELPIYTRARDLKAARKLQKAGSTMVVAETIEASFQLASSVLLGLGADEDVVNRRMELSRAYAINRIQEDE